MLLHALLWPNWWKLYPTRYDAIYNCVIGSHHVLGCLFYIILIQYNNTINLSSWNWRQVKALNQYFLFILWSPSLLQYETSNAIGWARQEKFLFQGQLCFFRVRNSFQMSQTFQLMQSFINMYNQFHMLQTFLYTIQWIHFKCRKMSSYSSIMWEVC